MTAQIKQILCHIKWTKKLVETLKKTVLDRPRSGPTVPHFYINACFFKMGV
jgi:hypothetical protein